MNARLFSRASMIVVMCVLFSAAAVAASVTAHHPSEGEVIDSYLPNFTVTYVGTQSNPSCRAREVEENFMFANGTVTNNTKSNLTMENTLSDGVYNYTVICETGDGVDLNDPRSGYIEFIQNASGTCCGGGDPGGGDGGSFYADDDAEIQTYWNTTSSYTPNLGGEIINISFIQHAVRFSGDGTQWYNLTNGTGWLLDETEGGFGATLNSDNAENISEGTAHVWKGINTTTTNPNRSRIDLVDASNHDVVGRITNHSGLMSTNPGDIELKLYHWLNNSPVSSFGSSDYSVQKLETSNTPEFLYKLNTSLDKYWIGADATGFGEQINPTRAVDKYSQMSFLQKADKPRVNEFMLNVDGNISGRLTWAENSTPVGTGITVRLSGFAGEGVQGRQPFVTKPPTKTNQTNPNGFYNFTGLAQGNYQLDVVGSPARSSFTAIQSKTILNGPKTTKPFQVTAWTGNVTGTITAPDKENLEYAVGVFGAESNQSSFYMTPGVDPNTPFSLTVPKGSYEVLALQVDYSGSFPSFNTKEVGLVNVPNGGEVPVDVSYAPKVPVDGYIKDGAGNTVGGESLQLENRSESLFEYVEVNESGYYSTRVSNNTNFSVTIRPPYDSDFKRTQANLSVTGNTTKNFTLATGKTLEGYVTSGGNGVDAFVNVWNSSQGSYGDAETNESGYYRITGLDDINYTMEVYPFRETLDRAKRQVNVSGDLTRKDITLSEAAKAKIEGSVTDEEGGALNATVRIRSENMQKSTSTNNTGHYVIDDLPRNVYYRMQVEPDQNKQYSSEETGVYLTENTTQDFSLSQVRGITGFVTKPDDTRVSGAYVYAYNFSTRSYGSAQTDSDGFYSVDVSGVNHTFEVFPGRNNDFTIERNESVNVSAYTSTSLNFTVSSGNTVTGDIKPASNNFEGEIGFWNESANSFGFTSFEDGNYSVSGLKDVGHDVRLSVQNDSYSNNFTTVSKSQVTSGTIDFSYKSGNKGRSIVVIVEDKANNVTLANASVVLSGDAKRTSSNGTVMFGRKEAGEQIGIEVARDNYKTTTKSISVKKRKSGSGSFSGEKEFQNVTVRLPNVQDSEVDVRVNLTEAGSAVSEATVGFFANATDTSHRRTSVTGGNGKATVEELVPANYTIGISRGPSQPILINSTAINATASGNLSMGSGHHLWYQVQ